MMHGFVGAPGPGAFMLGGPAPAPGHEAFMLGGPSAYTLGNPGNMSLANVYTRPGSQHRSSSGGPASKKRNSGSGLGMDTFPVKVHTFGQLVETCGGDVTEVMFRNWAKQWHPAVLGLRSSADLQYSLAGDGTSSPVTSWWFG